MAIFKAKVESQFIGTFQGKPSKQVVTVWERPARNIDEAQFFLDQHLKGLRFRNPHHRFEYYGLRRKPVARGVVPYSPAYNKEAVDKEITRDKRIGKREAKLIHALLKWNNRAAQGRQR
jgi:hypothetical protein